MSMIYAIYGTILALVLLSIIIGLANWFFASSVASKIASLEQEVEKKASEFDAIRKGQLTGGVVARPAVQDQVEPQYAPSADELSTESAGQQIEIVRNVRGVFESTDTSMDLAADIGHDLHTPLADAATRAVEPQTAAPGPDKVAPNSDHEQAQVAPTPPAPTAPVEPGAYDEPAESVQAIDTPVPVQGGQEETPAPFYAGPQPSVEPYVADSAEQLPAADAATGWPELDAPEEEKETVTMSARRAREIAGQAQESADSDVLDVVDDGAAVPEQSSEPFTVQLYSEASKDADFGYAWNALREILTTYPSPTIILNFANIQFLYEKEILYLRKIHAVVANQGGTMRFVNCDRELATLMQAYPDLQVLLGNNGAA